MDIIQMTSLGFFVAAAAFVAYKLKVFMRYENVMAREAKKTVLEWNVVYRDFVNSCATHNQELQVALSTLTREDAVLRYPTLLRLFETREKRDQCLKGVERADFMSKLQEDYLNYKYNFIPTQRPGLNLPNSQSSVFDSVQKTNGGPVLGLKQDIPN
ncbi:hypothetical protein [Vibrio owensii]|uniref:hypothetical protein n=1 Tax=Vibrio owensii TaxID=696485 RepID=UPI0018F1C222|nr:hypothetical protein [Vibrio owensii]